MPSRSMARRRERDYGRDELGRGMYSEDGTCLCCFLHCPPKGARVSGRGYPCRKALREYSFMHQVHLETRVRDG